MPRKERRLFLTRSEDYVPPLPQALPVGELLAESEATVLGEAEDVEVLVVDELRGAPLPVVHLDSVQLLDSQGCRLGKVAGFSVTNIHGP